MIFSLFLIFNLDYSTRFTEHSEEIQSILIVISGLKFTLAIVLAHQEKIKTRLDRIEEKQSNQDFDKTMMNSNVEDLGLPSLPKNLTKSS